MGAATITVDSTESFKQRVKAAFAGKRQQERISFESFDLLWKMLAPNRMALVQTLTGAGPVTLREAARRVGRDGRGGAVESAVPAWGGCDETGGDAQRTSCGSLESLMGAARHHEQGHSETRARMRIPHQPAVEARR